VARSLRVFISYSSSDKDFAQKLYRDLSSAGAKPFEFVESSSPGSAAWSQILEWISDSDVFIVLLSSSTPKSRAVKEEMEQANYS